MGLLDAKTSQTMPVRKSTYNDPWFGESAEGRDMLQWKRYIDKLGVVYRKPERMIRIYVLLGEAAVKMLTQKLSPERVLTEACEKYNSEAGLAE